METVVRVKEGNVVITINNGIVTVSATDGAVIEIQTQDIKLSEEPKEIESAVLSEEQMSMQLIDDISKEYLFEGRAFSSKNL